LDTFDNPTVNKINNLSITNNIIYNWGGVGMNVQGDSFTDLLVQDNVIRSHQNDEAWSTNDSAQLGDITANTNKFWTNVDDPDQTIYVLPDFTTFASWEAALAGGSGNTHTDVSYSDPTRSIARYNSEVLSGTESFDEFMSSVRDQRRGNWDNRLRASDVNGWIRTGFVEI